MNTNTMALAEISLDDLNLVSGGRAKETLGRWGENLGGAMDSTYDAAVALPGQIRDAGVAAWNATTQFVDDAQKSARHGIANGLDAASAFVRPKCGPQ